MTAGDVVAPSAQSTGEKKVFNRLWCKLYATDILGDKTLNRLTDSQFRAWIGLLALANDTYEPGFIDLDTAGIAAMLRVPKRKMAGYLDYFEAVHLIHREDGLVEIENRKRFYFGTGCSYSASREGQAERKRAQRARAASSGDACHGESHSDSHSDAPEHKEECKSEGEPGVKPKYTVRPSSVVSRGAISRCPNEDAEANDSDGPSLDL